MHSVIEVLPGDDGFRLLRFWARRFTSMEATNTKEVGLPAKAAQHLGPLTRLYPSLGDTSCQAKIHVSPLSFLIGDLRTRTTSTKRKQMMMTCLPLDTGNNPEV